ncbi:NADH-ubiquinone oxidoreductase 12 kDa subunit [Hibiscus syriacus]|uniref:Small ribosomal subunit protein mS29 n=1 Tax=Hibiscus syriacus TaxID=106335 RepID=A0A6A2YUX6_HIBSY|nr:NADH-ubiquinone oxidoreductase 12 kDa subunit [Hibiscus syriacus]
MLRSIAKRSTLLKPRSYTPLLVSSQSKLYSSKTEKSKTKSKSKSKTSDSSSAVASPLAMTSNLLAPTTSRMLEPAPSPKTRKQVVLDGPVSCGKSIALAMLVHWARDEGGLVLYAPRGREWTHGGFFYKTLKQDFLKYNESRIQSLLCQIFYPIRLGEGAGVGWMKGVESMAVPKGATLYDLIQMGIKYTHAAVGVVVRLREELSLVKDVPVLIAIDQVNAFRSMMHEDMMDGAFSHSTAVGKLRLELPNVPVDACVNMPRYSPDEAESVCHYYLRQRLIRREAFSEESWKKVYYLPNGNGAEMRWLLPLMR